MAVACGIVAHGTLSSLLLQGVVYAMPAPGTSPSARPGFGPQMMMVPANMVPASE
jgi:hypothetical protein